MKFGQFMSCYKRKKNQLHALLCLKQATYIRYVYNSKTIKICLNQHADLIRLPFTEDSLKI